MKYNSDFVQHVLPIRWKFRAISISIGLQCNWVRTLSSSCLHKLGSRCLLLHLFPLLAGLFIFKWFLIYRRNTKFMLLRSMVLLWSENKHWSTRSVVPFCGLRWTLINKWPYLWTLWQKSFNEAKGLVCSKSWYL